MNSQILVKLNNFIKNRLIEFAGTLLVIIGIFLLISIASYSPSDPNFIYTPENTNIKNANENRNSSTETRKNIYNIKITMLKKLKNDESSTLSNIKSTYN